MADGSGERLGNWLLISDLTLGRAEKPAGQAKCADDTANNLNELLRVVVLDEGTAK